MNDLDRYLIPTEAVEVAVRRHWASLTRSALIEIGLLAVSVFIMIFLGNISFFATLGTLALLASIGWFLWVLLDWKSERFVITDKRVLLINGLLTKRVAIMPLSKVTDLTYERPVVGRLLGYGVFIMESAGQQQALSRIDFLPTPDVLYQQVSSLLFGPRPDRRTRVEDSGRLRGPRDHWDRSAGGSAERPDGYRDGSRHDVREGGDASEMTRSWRADARRLSRAHPEPDTELAQSRRGFWRGWRREADPLTDRVDPLSEQTTRPLPRLR